MRIDSRRSILVLTLLAAATVFSGTALADPPPYPELTITNNTGRTVSGCFGASYVEAGHNYQTFNGIPSDGCYPDREPSVTLAPGESKTRSTSARFSTDGVSAVYFSFVKVNGAGPYNVMLSGSQTEKQFGTDHLWARIAIGLPTGFLGLGGTGWTGRDYVRMYLEWR